ncbi:MAG TPA: hypothetical protein VGY97_03890 [Solirubrobacteraceae bacterium]|nr:hypothetical protein [Solirubrobacteraceae bacterium]
MNRPGRCSLAAAGAALLTAGAALLTAGAALLTAGAALLVAGALLAGGLSASPASAQGATSGRVGPALSITSNGRQLSPLGRLTRVGDFPTGGALSPDGRFFWAVDAGHGRDHVQVVDVGTGAVIHTRYDQESVLRTVELILGMKPLSLFDAQAAPMWDAFVANGQADVTPYTAVQPEQSLAQVSSSSDVRRAGPLAQALPFDRPDAVPQALFDRVLWHRVYGPRSRPPSPGPGASMIETQRANEALAAFRGHRSVREVLLRPGADPFAEDLARAASLGLGGGAAGPSGVGRTTNGTALAPAALNRAAGNSDG